jgi:hypothetical protein
MFEFALENTTSSVFVDTRDADLASRCGFSFDLSRGLNTLSYSAAVSLVSRMYKAIPSIRYAKDAKRLNSLINQIMFSFGPEFVALHSQQ